MLFSQICPSLTVSPKEALHYFPRITSAHILVESHWDNHLDTWPNERRFRSSHENWWLQLQWQPDSLYLQVDISPPTTAVRDGNWHSFSICSTADQSEVISIDCFQCLNFLHLHVQSVAQCESIKVSMRERRQLEDMCRNICAFTRLPEHFGSPYPGLECNITSPPSKRRSSPMTSCSLALDLRVSVSLPHRRWVRRWIDIVSNRDLYVYRRACMRT